MPLRLNPQAYTSRDFDAVLTDALAAKNALTPAWTDDNISDTGRMIVEQAAGMDDMLHWTLNQYANQLYPFSITVFKYMRQIARWLDYQIREASEATVTLTFTRHRDAPSGDIVIPKGSLIATRGQSNVVTFETTQNITLPTPIAPQTNVDVSATVVAVNAVTKLDTFVTRGVANESFLLTSIPLLWGSETVTIGGNVYSRVTNTLDSGSADRHYTVVVEERGQGRVVLGDGVNGFLPPMGQTATVEYKVGGGSSGNVAAQSLTHVVDESLAGLVTVTNLLPAQGGSDTETLEEAKVRAPLAVSANQRSVSGLDFVTHAEQVGGVLRAEVLTVNDSDSIEEGTVVVLVVPDAVDPTTGLPQEPTTALKKKVLDYIEAERPTLVTARVIAGDPDYYDVAPELNIWIRGIENLVDVKNAVIDNITSWFDLSARNTDGTYRIKWGGKIYDSRLCDLVWDANDTLGADIVKDVEVVNPTDDIQLQLFQIPVASASTIVLNFFDTEET